MILVSDDLKKSEIEKIFQSVKKKMNFENNSVWAIFLGKKFDCEEIAEKLGLENNKKFEKICRDLHASISFNLEGREFLIIKMNEKLLENESALKGLLAHELMHSYLRISGTEKYLEDRGLYFFKKFLEIFGEKIGKKEARNFLTDITKNAIFSLKDIIANSELIKKRFSKDLENYYEGLISKNFCPMPSFYGREATLVEVKNAVIFELQLLPVWLPFFSTRKKKSEIENRIRSCYETNIEELALHIRGLKDVYSRYINNAQKLINKFFEVLFEELLHIIRDIKQFRTPP